VTCQNPSVADTWCQPNGSVRLPAPWTPCTNTFDAADQPLLVVFGVWQNEQVGPSLRWPTWNVGLTPRPPWQALHFAVSTVGRRAAAIAAGTVVSGATLAVAAFARFGVGTMRPPTCVVASYGNPATLVCVSGCTHGVVGAAVVGPPSE
jgi:hypothetical protein